MSKSKWMGIDEYGQVQWRMSALAGDVLGLGDIEGFIARVDGFGGGRPTIRDPIVTGIEGERRAVDARRLAVACRNFRLAVARAMADGVSPDFSKSERIL